MWGRVCPHVLLLLLANLFKASCEGTSSLTFVIDDTGSMTDDIDQVKSSVNKIMDIVFNEKSSLIYNMVLVTVNDPDSKVRVVTKKRSTFKTALNAVYAHNIYNYDCWEPSMKGLLLALEKSRPGSYLYVFTDATAKDHVDSAAVIEMCQRKQSQITFVLTGRCWGYQKKVFKVYYDIAAACSGLAFYVKKNEVNQVLRTLEETIKGNKTVLTTKTVPPGVYTDIPFTIDEQTDYAIVSVSGTRVSLGIAGPFARQERIMWNDNGKVIKLSDAIPGKYVATVMGHSSTSVVIVGRTDFLFSHGFSELEPKKLSDTTPQPIADANVYLSISVTDPKHEVRIDSAQILQMDEKPIQELPLRKISSNFYITKPFVAPSQMFKVAVKGIVKTTGKRITRIAKIPVTPQKPPKKLPNKTKPTANIVEGTSVEVEYDSMVKLTCKVTAYPKPKITWSNSKGAKLPSSNSVFQYPYEYISHMTIYNVLKGNKYKCNAANNEGNDFKTINVNVKDPLVIKNIPTETTKVVYGSEGTITCDIRSKKSMNIFWYYVNKKTADNRQIVTSDKYWISPDGTQLKINKMDLDLVGTYTCKASLIDNKDVQKTYNTLVKIDGLITPKVTGATDKKVIKGANAVLECKIVNGIPKPKIIWQFMDKAGSKYVPLASSKNVLRISNVQDKNAGRYKCVAENVVGRDEHAITLIIQELPKIKSPSTVYQSIEGDALLRIPCVSTGLPKPVITWKLNGRAIIPNAKYATENGALIIKDPKVSDTNSYTCEATNDVGSVSATFKTHIFQIPKLSGIPIKKVRIGTTANVECKVVKGEPKPKITWQFMAKTGSKFVPITGYDNVLRITSAEIKHAGWYKCVAQNNVGTDEYVTTLTVQDLPKITSSASTIYQTIEGESLLRIPCVATGLPKPTITWKLKSFTITPNAKYSTEDGALTIRDPKVSDTNSYTCEATNEVGSVSAIFQTHILQTPKVLGVAAKKVRIGTSAIIDCMVMKGEPKPKITWQFIEKSGSKFAPIAGSENVLRILSAKNEQAGRYKCVAQNIVGSDEHVTTIIVESPPRIISNSTAVIEGLEGDLALRIACDVVGVPQPVITWKLKGAAITRNAKYSIEDGALVIMNPNGKDSENYKCEAKNYIDSVSATFQANIDKFLIDLGVKHPVYLLEAETKKLKCEAYSSRTQSVRWFINGEENKTTKTPYFEVRKASVSDDGNYTCRVSDKHGNAYTHTNVVNVGRPPNLYDQTLLNNWRGDINEILSNCESDAEPTADVHWKFNGKVLTDRNLKDLGISYQWGHYACNVSNVHGSVQRTFDVKSSVCLINRNLKDAHNMPLLLTDGHTWPLWETTKNYLVVEQEEKITLSCPNLKEAPNAFQKFPKQNELKAFCYKEDKFLVDGKLYKLSDLHCTNNIQPTIIRKKINCLTDTSELIRVGYNVEGFLETYEVCFDHAKNMPLYTRALMTPTDGSLDADHNWHKYPGISDGKRNRGLTCENTLSTCCYSQSQLVNARDFNYNPEKYTTFIDPLNAIPLWRPCKNATKTTWEDVDVMVRSQFVNYDEIVAWSGTHTLQEKHGAVIPRFLWKVLRFDEDEPIAIVHVNDPLPTDKDIKCVNNFTTEKISWFTPSDEYTYCCKLSDFLKAFDLRGTDIGEPKKVALEKIEKRT